MRTLAMPFLVLLLVVASRPSVHAGSELPERTGYVDVPGGKVWYRIVGEGKKTPLLLLHGGPGAPSQYLKPMAALADERPVIFYDQLGCGHSPAADDTSLWNIDRFVQELAAVRKALGLEEIHLYGHSWGTILANEYLATKPAGIRSVIMGSPCLSSPLWAHTADSLLATLSDSVQLVLKKNEEAGTTSSQEYQDAMMVFYHRYVAAKEPWSIDIDSTFVLWGASVYGYMWGASEFAITGTLRSYDGMEHLHEITLPTLFTVGEHDEAGPGTVRYFQSLVPKSELAVIPNAAHLTM